MAKPIPASGYFDIPAGVSGVECRGKDCSEEIFWVKNPATGRMVPVSCDLDGLFPPDSQHTGRGVNHYHTCPNANDFHKRKGGPR